MTTEAIPEICHSCGTGTLVATEGRPDGYAKHFSCGHTHYDIHVEDTLEFHASLGYKAKSQGKGKPYIEGKAGDDRHRNTGKWMHLQRIIDRVGGWYTEVVTDQETGKVVHRCEEPLSEHRGHGSAKSKLMTPVVMRTTTI
jgi:hypothetical protein